MEIRLGNVAFSTYPIPSNKFHRDDNRSRKRNEKTNKRAENSLQFFAHWKLLKKTIVENFQRQQYTVDIS